jgi:hypothetical protein
MPSFSRRPETITRAPSRAKARAVARPIPEVPPVMRATLETRLDFMVVWQGGLKPALLRCNDGAAGRRMPSATERLDECDTGVETEGLELGGGALRRE